MRDWDQRYAESGTRLFGEAPNEYVREVMARSDFDIRTALCLGDGDGRNGLWLAEQGIAVTAVDISRTATDMASEHDRVRGVDVERIVADLARWQPEAGKSWDAAFMVYLQCESETRRRATAIAASAISPGGWFVAEGFARHGVLEDPLGPKSPDLLYGLEDLLPLLGDFRIVEALEGRIWLEEGSKHRGNANIVRILARREML